MGKNYCKVEKKWCRFLKRGICGIANCKLAEVNRCPRLSEIETIRLYDLLKEVNFENVFTRLCYWFNDQKQSKEGYEKVFKTLLAMTPSKHKLSDLFITVDKVTEDNGDEWISVYGEDVLKKDNISYGIEFSGWNEWVSMFITQTTLDNFTKEDIVAGCLYEMTFWGFEEAKVIENRNMLVECAKDAKEKLNIK